MLSWGCMRLRSRCLEFKSILPVLTHFFIGVSGSTLGSCGSTALHRDLSQGVHFVCLLVHRLSKYGYGHNIQSPMLGLSLEQPSRLWCTMARLFWCWALSSVPLQWQCSPGVRLQGSKYLLLISLGCQILLSSLQCVVVFVNAFFSM